MRLCDLRPLRVTLIAICVLLGVVSWCTAALGAQLTLTWVDNADDEVGFAVERSAGGSGPFTEIASTGRGATSHTDGTVAAGATYCYRVRAFNEEGYSAYTNVACAVAAAAPVSLAVVKVGDGNGLVKSAPAGIDCGPACSGSFAGGTVVTLTATALSSSRFDGWSGGGCSGTGGCKVTPSTPTTVTPTFSILGSATLTVTVAGAGSGTVSSAPAGIACGTTCSASYAGATPLTLTAKPAAGSTFAGWKGGGCGAANPCTVNLTANANTSVQATFALGGASAVRLTVKRTGTGRGTVTSTPRGINCGRTCSASYASGTQVTLAANPAKRSTFTGWSGGGCGQTRSCKLSLSAATSVTASFARCGWRATCP